ncbi:MAG: DNA-binding protein [Dehalococcoidia bacterium]|nr:DNA-binding protein [Dehalococcoidia bacterium]
MTLEEVSKYLRLAKSTVYRMANKGRIPVSKIGRRWRFRKDVIDAWLSEQEKM